MANTIWKEVFLIMCSSSKENARNTERFPLTLRITDNYTLHMLCGAPHNIVNEEGKINGLPLNRAIRNDDGVIIDIAAGNLMITGLGESDFISLDEGRIKKYSERFRTPEMFLRVNGQLHVLPMPEPKPRGKHGEER